jgi:hypothetical protein
MRNQGQQVSSIDKIILKINDMNNDLSKLSDGELHQKKIEVSESELFIKRVLMKNQFEYNKMLRRRWANPIKVLSFKEDIEVLKKIRDHLYEYSRTLTDESNRRL